MDRQGHVLGLGIELLADVLSQHPGCEIRWGRFNTNLRDHNGPGRLCRGLVFLNHQGDPGHLASDVEVVSASLGTGANNVLAILAVRADGGDEDARLLSECFELRKIVCVGNLNGYKRTLERGSSYTRQADDNGLRWSRCPPS